MRGGRVPPQQASMWPQVQAVWEQPCFLAPGPWELVQWCHHKETPRGTADRTLQAWHGPLHEEGNSQAPLFIRNQIWAGAWGWWGQGLDQKWHPCIWHLGVWQPVGRLGLCWWVQGLWVEGMLATGRAPKGQAQLASLPSPITSPRSLWDTRLGRIHSWGVDKSWAPHAVIIPLPARSRTPLGGWSEGSIWGQLLTLQVT